MCDQINPLRRIPAEAAWRLAYLRRLADLGMRLAEEVIERAVNAPYHPEPAHEPARAFATVSRGVRLTLVLHERMEAKFIALRNGGAPGVERAAVARGTCEKRANVDDAVLDEALDDPPERSDRSRETLREFESERFEDLVSGPFDDCVAVIRADLGLAPDGDVPSDEAGVEAALESLTAVASSHDEAPGPVASGVPAGAPHPVESG